MTQPRNNDEQTQTNKSIFGWKGVLFFLLFAGGFLGFLFFAMSQEPDYMPAKRKEAAAKAQQEKLAQQQNQTTATPASEATASTDNHGHNHGASGAAHSH